MYAVVCFEEVWYVLPEGICRFPDSLVVTESADLVIKTGCTILVSMETGMGHDCVNDMFDCSS